MSDVLIVSSGIIHPPVLGRFYLGRRLVATPGVRVHHARNLSALAAADPDELDAVVLYFHRQRMPPRGLEALETFARAGGGILALHSATASFKEVPRYANVLGGRFAGHPPGGRLEILPAAGSAAVFDVTSPFTIRDEAYRHALCDDICVHFTARCPTGETVPFVWTRSYGAGRVCYVGAGHRSGSLRHPSIQRILQAGLAWVCGAAPEATA